MTPGAMLARLGELRGTGAATPWESSFIRSCQNTVGPANKTFHLSPRQVEGIEKIYHKYFLQKGGQ